MCYSVSMKKRPSELTIEELKVIGPAAVAAALEEDIAFERAARNEIEPIITRSEQANIRTQVKDLAQRLSRLERALEQKQEVDV
jgi:hypothetical protein